MHTQYVEHSEGILASSDYGGGGEKLACEAQFMHEVQWV